MAEDATFLFRNLDLEGVVLFDSIGVDALDLLLQVGVGLVLPANSHVVVGLDQLLLLPQVHRIYYVAVLNIIVVGLLVLIFLATALKLFVYMIIVPFKVGDLIHEGRLDV